MWILSFVIFIFRLSFWIYFQILCFYYILDFCDFLFKHYSRYYTCVFPLLVYWQVNGIVYDSGKANEKTFSLCSELFQTEIVLDESLYLLYRGFPKKFRGQRRDFYGERKLYIFIRKPERTDGEKNISINKETWKVQHPWYKLLYIFSREILLM